MRALPMFWWLPTWPGRSDMPDIRWVCLSDTHFGAENSLLSHLPDGSVAVDPDTAGPVMETFVSCLRDLTRSTGSGHRPTLVLNGDILEFALAQDNVAAMVFDRFIDLAFKGDEPVFDSEVIYIPGNHDHHIWETARERQYAHYVQAVDPNSELAPPWHVTKLFRSQDSEPLQAELLTALVRRRLGSDAHVNVIYPNLGITTETTSNIVVLHHGHFVEPLYRLMSTFKETLFPGQAPGDEIWDWEADNFAWIDFFWSTLGRSGAAGEDVGLIYDMLQDGSALAALAGNLGTAAGDHAPRLLRWLAGPGASLLARRVALQVRDRERAKPGVLLSEKAEAGLVRYLTGPLLRQLHSEHSDTDGGHVHFVFGHTHKPFERMQIVEKYGQPVSIFNTGGWVVDTERTASLQGAAVVVIDDDCNLASLRLYNQSTLSSDYRVALSATLSEPSNALQSELAKRLDFAQPPWSTFSEVVGAAVEQRHSALPRIIQRGLHLAS